MKALGSEYASAHAALAAVMATGDEVEGNSDEVEDDSDPPESDPAIPATVAALQQQRDDAHYAVVDATALHLGSLLPFDNLMDATLAEAVGNMLRGCPRPLCG